MYREESCGDLHVYTQVFVVCMFSQSSTGVRALQVIMC